MKPTSTQTNYLVETPHVVKSGVQVFTFSCIAILELTQMHNYLNSLLDSAYNFDLLSYIYLVFLFENSTVLNIFVHVFLYKSLQILYGII